MALFTNPFSSDFFSVAGQKERLQNVVDVVSTAFNPFSKDKVVANVQDATAKATLEFVANNPYTTAGIISAGAAAPARSAIGSAVSGLSTTTKLVAGAATVAAVPALATSERLRVGAIKAIDTVTPEKIASFGAKTGNVVQNPSSGNLKNYLKEEAPLIATAVGATALIGGLRAAGVASTALSVIATEQNTKATEKAVAAAQAAPAQLATAYQNAYAKAAPALGGLGAPGTPSQTANVMPQTPMTATTPDNVKQVNKPYRKPSNRKRYKSTLRENIHGLLTLRIAGRA